MSPSERKKHVARVREDAGNIAGDEVFVFAQADDHGRAIAGSDDFARILGRRESPERRRR